MNFESLSDAIRKARFRTADLIRHTPLEYARFLSQQYGCEIYLKLENFQVTGSFKIRGAANFVLSLAEEGNIGSVIAASSGNHGVALAHTLDHLKASGRICLPENVSPSKLAVLRSYNVEILFHGTDVGETEAFSRDLAEKEGGTIVPPYNHPAIVAGQGTIGCELTEGLKNIDAVFVPVGGGGLISGIAAWMKTRASATQIVACQPENSAVMYHSIKAGKIVDIASLPTWADGTAGGIEADAITFPIVQECVDDFVLVSEEDIRAAILYMIEHHQMMVEGAAALSLAAFLKTADQYRRKTVVLIISGTRLTTEALRKLML